MYFTRYIQLRFGGESSSLKKCWVSVYPFDTVECGVLPTLPVIQRDKRLTNGIIELFGIHWTHLSLYLQICRDLTGPILCVCTNVGGCGWMVVEGGGRGGGGLVGWGSHTVLEMAFVSIVLFSSFQ